MSDAFKSLKGVNKERHSQEEDKKLDNILRLSNDYVKTYSKKIPHDLINKSEVFDVIFQNLKSALKKEIIDEATVKSFIFINSNMNYPDDIAQVIGMCSGALLQMLTEQNLKEGKETFFHIDGNKSRFDYLFYLTPTIDELIVENFVGEGICKGIATFGGKANLVMMINNEGTELGSKIGGFWGNAKNVIFCNNKGEDIGTAIGTENGQVERIIMLNNLGNKAFQNLGFRNGIVKKVIASNNSGDHFLKRSGAYKGWVGSIHLLDHKGLWSCNEVGAYHGRVDLINVLRLNGDSPCHCLADMEGKVGSVFIANSKANHPTGIVKDFRGEIGQIFFINNEGSLDNIFSQTIDTKKPDYYINQVKQEYISECLRKFGKFDTEFAIQEHKKANSGIDAKKIYLLAEALKGKEYLTNKKDFDSICRIG